MADLYRTYISPETHPENRPSTSSLWSFMNISSFGLGYVGAVSLACLARDGHKVIGVDISRDKLDLIRAGRSPIIEEGIQELMQQVVASGRVSVTDNAAQAIAATDV